MQESSVNSIIIGLVILMIVGLGIAGSYYHHKIKYANFQQTIGDLSDEQKCMHICGFQYPASAYFDQYKFCIEKCDRISEREMRIMGG